VTVTDFRYEREAHVQFNFAQRILTLVISSVPGFDNLKLVMPNAFERKWKQCCTFGCEVSF